MLNETEALYAALGGVTMALNNLDDFMVALMQALGKAPVRGAVEVLTRRLPARAKLEALRNLVFMRDPEAARERKFKNLMTRLGRLYERRNKLIHGLILVIPPPIDIVAFRERSKALGRVTRSESVATMGKRLAQLSNDIHRATLELWEYGASRNWVPEEFSW